MAGTYRNLEILGQGGMAKVFRADDVELDRSVAIKELSEELAQNERHLVQFVAEGRKMASINHPNVVQIFSIEDEGDEPPRLVMELAAGTLLEHLRAGPMDVSVVERVARQVLGGLEAVHQAGWVHRDIKPANILYFENGLFKIGDFGIATGGDEHTQLLATPKYMAPEMLTRPRLVGPASDLYCLGLVLYEALVGPARFQETVEQVCRTDGDPAIDPDASTASRHLWQTFHAGADELPPVRDLRSDVPGSLSDWIARLVRKEISERFSTCREALLTLDRDQPSATVSDGVPGVEATQRVAPVVRKGLSTLQLVLIGLLVAVLLGGGFLVFSGSSRIPVRLTTDPSGAAVLFEGQEVGRTPFERRVRGGHTLELRLDGFEPLRVTVPETSDASEEAPHRIHGDLPWAEPLSLASRPEGARVLRNGTGSEELGTTPLDFRGHGSSETLELSLAGYEPVSVRVEAGSEPEPVILRPQLPGPEIAESPARLRDALTPFLTDDAGIRLRLLGSSGPENLLPFGRRLRLDVEVPTDAFAALFLLQSNGDALLLYPSPRAGDLRLAAGVATELPLAAHAAAGYRLVASEPAGEDQAYLLTSGSPLSSPPRGRALGDWSSVFPFDDGDAPGGAASLVRWAAEAVRGSESARLARLSMRVEP